MRSLQPLILATLLALLAIMALAPSARAEAPPDVPTSALQASAVHQEIPRAHARLLIDHEEASPGQTIRVGVLLHMHPNWHVYWRRSGDSGMPTSIQWSLPDGWSADALQWPAPRSFSEADDFIRTYAYSDHVLIWSSITIPQDAAAGLTSLGARVDYLVCDDLCVPGDADLSHPLLISDKMKQNVSYVTHFVSSVEAIPLTDPTHARSHKLVLPQTPLPASSTSRVAWLIDLCPDANPSPCDLELDLATPDDPAHFSIIPDHSPHITWRTTALRVEPPARLIVHLDAKVSPSLKAATQDTLRAVIRLQDRSAKPRHVELTTPVPVAPTDALSIPADAQDRALLNLDAPSTYQAPTTTDAPRQPTAPPAIGLVWAMLLAMLGGLLLNLMPCVFPVLSLKLASLARMSGDSPKKMLQHGLCYTAGIATTMALLTTIVLGLRAAGEQVGWGFQFQNPWFIVFLACVVTVFAANLLGAFELSTPQLHDATNKLPDHPLWHSFAEGLLCVLLATPCSAPFMGTAVGFALSADALTILLIFQALGLGLASPFLILTAAPAWRRLLPKPGPWFDTLRQALAFSMLATACWLLWIFGQTQGVDGMTRLLITLVILAAASWLWGLSQLATPKKKIALISTALIISSTSLLFILDVQREPSAQDIAATTTHTSGGITWQPFSPEAVQTALDAGHPVFLDFTADWCITCKVNERGPLSSQAVIDAFAQANVVTLKADWTRRDEQIRAILASFGRGGVPMYLMYSPKRPEQPQLLPELLTPSILLQATRDATSSPK